jgi:hypothetical protein
LVHEECRRLHDLNSYIHTAYTTNQQEIKTGLLQHVNAKNRPRKKQCNFKSNVFQIKLCTFFRIRPSGQSESMDIFRTPWARDRPIAKPYTGQHTTEQRRHTSTCPVRFEPMISLFQRPRPYVWDLIQISSAYDCTNHWHCTYRNLITITRRASWYQLRSAIS